MKRAIAAALLALTACCAETAPVKPTLYVLTSLPLLFDEGFAVGPAKGEAAVFLRAHYTLRPIDLPSQLPPHATLLAAQPRALPAEELVALDAWVRGGGRLVLLADPLLEWPSKRPLGDRLRPPLSFADTGLLAHWGLRLDAPGERGPRTVTTDAEPSQKNGKRFDLKVVMVSPGSLVREQGTCEVIFERTYSECSLGAGVALVVADADWLSDEAIATAKGNINPNLFALGTVLRAASDYP